MKKPISALASQWSGTYMHSVHTRRAGGCRGIVCTCVRGEGRQGKKPPVEEGYEWM